MHRHAFSSLPSLRSEKWWFSDAYHSSLSVVVLIVIGNVVVVVVVAVAKCQTYCIIAVLIYCPEAQLTVALRCLLLVSGTP